MEKLLWGPFWRQNCKNAICFAIFVVVILFAILMPKFGSVWFRKSNYFLFSNFPLFYTYFSQFNMVNVFFQQNNKFSHLYTFYIRNTWNICIIVDTLCEEGRKIWNIGPNPKILQKNVKRAYMNFHKILKSYQKYYKLIGQKSIVSGEFIRKYSKKAEKCIFSRFEAFI